MSAGAVPRAPIRRLSPATIERIAAGEVVERPASVVKELVENAIDAGATAVTVRLREGGLASIEVEDDGAGIVPEELDLALAPHATSKLAPDGPVDEVTALGFRGEALAAIATVARLRLTSRPPGLDGAEGIAVEGGSPPQRFVGARAPGTTLEVRDLFFNTPARRKFLRRPAIEQLEVVRTLERVYLAHPAITLRLESEGGPIAVLPAARSMEDAAAHVLGASLLREGFRLRAPIPGGTVRGILGRPSTAAPHSTGLHVSVNGRAIVARGIAQAVRAAYADLIPKGRFPVGAIDLELAPDRVDVNVHPTKREVRFAHERELTEAIRRAVRETLLAVPRVASPGTLPGERAPAPAPPFSESGIAPGGLAASAVQRRLLPDPADSLAPAGGAGRSGPRLLGCLDRLYWVAESDTGFVLIDQHAASERVLFDALLSEGRLARQELVVPFPLSLTPSQRATLAAESEAIESSGFAVEPFGPAMIRVRAVPTFRGSRARPEAFGGFLDELAEGGRPVPGAGLRERRAAIVACHAAIRAGDPVEAEELCRVLAALERAPGPGATCPHGRPIFVELSRARLDQWFLRSGL